MKERPIIFGASDVRAILTGRKTQTRRVVRPQPEERGAISDRAPGFASFDEKTLKTAWCPFGWPGHRLWVRETWGLHMHGDFTCWHRDSIKGRTEEDLRFSWEVAYAADAGSPYDHWRPSIHMPRWASRLALEVTGVRVERLCDISEKDARAEGVEVVTLPEEWMATRPSPLGGRDAIAFHKAPSPALIEELELEDVRHVPARPVQTAVAGFRQAWSAVNGSGFRLDGKASAPPESWAANPWVWAISFRRVTP